MSNKNGSIDLNELTNISGLSLQEAKEKLEEATKQIQQLAFQEKAIAEKNKQELNKKLNSSKNKIYSEHVMKKAVQSVSQETEINPLEIKFEDFLIDSSKTGYILEIPIADFHINEGSMDDMNRWDLHEFIITLNFIMDNIITFNSKTDKIIKQVVFNFLGDMVDTWIHYELKNSLTLGAKQTAQVAGEAFANVIDLLLKNKELNKKAESIGEKFSVLTNIVVWNHAEQREEWEKPNTMINNADYWMGEEIKLFLAMKWYSQSEISTMVNLCSPFAYTMPVNIGSGKNTRVLSHQDRDGGKLEKTMVQITADYGVDVETSDRIYYDVGHYHSEDITLLNDETTKTQYTCGQPTNLYSKNGYAGAWNWFQAYMGNLVDSTGKRIYTYNYHIKDWVKRNIGFVYFSAENLITKNSIDLYRAGNKGDSITSKDFNQVRTWNK